MVDPGKEIACGAAAGSVGKLIEFPFDTVKVRLQLAHPVPLSRALTLQVVAQTYRTEGLVHGFYKGIKAPLVGACLESAVLFSAYEYGQQLCRRAGFDPLLVAGTSAAGAFSGFAASFVLTPVELVKCNLQVANLHGASGASYASILAQIVRQHGLRGMWRGLLLTLAREMAGTAVWFATYESGLARIRQWWPELPAAALLLGGAAAGFMFNLSIYPLDTVKLNIQTSHVTGVHHQGVVAVAAHLLAKPGHVANLYRGLTITLMRSLPANAAIFYTYDWLKERC